MTAGLRVENSRFLRFLLTSGVAALINFVMRWLFDLVVPFEVAVALAFPFGVLSAYILAKMLVFDPSSIPVRVQLARFTMINTVSLILVWVVSVGLARVVFPAAGFSWHADNVAHLVGIASPALFAYLAHQRYSFQRN